MGHGRGKSAGSDPSIGADVYHGIGCDISGGHFGLGDLTADGDFHDLDISSLIPLGCSAIQLHVRGTLTAPSTITGVIYFRPASQSEIYSTCTLRPGAANVAACAYRLIAVNNTRKFQYKLQPTNTFTDIKITVKGYFR